MPMWVWIVVGAGLILNLLGVAAYLAEAFGSGRSEAHDVLISARPVWATVAYAIAVFGGVIGCVALLMRRRLALPVLLASFVALLVQQAWNFAGSGVAFARTSASAGFAAAVVVVSVGLIALALAASRQGWLR